MSDTPDTLARGIGQTARMTFDRGGGAAAAAAGIPLTDDQIMADLLKIYYQEVYIHAVRAEFNRRFGKGVAKTAADRTFRRQRVERFLRAIEKVVLPTLQKRGWSPSRASQRGYVAEFEPVVADWAAARYQLAIPSPTNIDFDPDLIAPLPGGYYAGPQSGYNARVKQLQAQRALQTLRNIASGPLGAFGYFVAGDAGSDVGALLESVAIYYGSRAQAREGFKALSQPPDQRAVAAQIATSPSTRGTDNPGTAAGPVVSKLPAPPPAALAPTTPAVPPAAAGAPPAGGPPSGGKPPSGGGPKPKGKPSGGKGSSKPPKLSTQVERSVGQAVAANVQGLDPTTNFDYRGSQLGTIATDLQRRQAQLQADGKGALLPKIDTSWMKLSFWDFLKLPQNRDLKNRYEQLLSLAMQEQKRGYGALYKQLRDFASAGVMRTRKPDTIEVRLDQGIVSLTDPTLKSERPDVLVHEFKTRFYGAAMRAMLPNGPSVEAFEHNTSLGIHRPAR